MKLYCKTDPVTNTNQLYTESPQTGMWLSFDIVPWRHIFVQQM